MNCQNYKFVTDGNDVMNELCEKINHLQYELEYLKGRETHPINSLFQDDLNKIKTGLKLCSNAIQNTNDLFKTCDKNNTEISVELKALKRELNKRFDEEKHLCKSRNELLNFLKKEMVKLQNIAKQLGNEAKNLRDGLKEEHERVPAACSITQSTQDLLKNSEKRITETSNELKDLKKEISKCLSDRTGYFNKGSFVKEEDLLKVRNGVLNVYSSGIQQVHEINKEMSNEIKNLDEGLKKQQEKIGSIVESTNTIIRTRKNLKIRQSLTENSIQQFSSEIKNLQSEFKAEQQKNRFLENKLMIFESHLKEILLRNDIKYNPNKEISIDLVPAPNTSIQSDFLPEICKFAILDPQTKEQGEMDMQSKMLIHDFERMDIAPKVHDNANFNEEVKSKFACEEVKVKDISEEECMVSFPENTEAFYEEELSHLSVHSQIDELTENQCTDVAFESSSGKEGALSYLEKAHAYLQNLQMSGIFPLSDEESSTVLEDRSSVAGDLGNDAKKGISLYLVFSCQFAVFFSTSLYWCFISWVKLT